jgi:hypothetical protein
MRQVFVVVRVVQGNGCGLVSNHSVFDNEDEAKKCATELQAEFQDAMGCRLLEPSGKDSWLVLRDVIKGLGVVGIGHNVVPAEVHSADLLVAPPSRIILT